MASLLRPDSPAVHRTPVPFVISQTSYCPAPLTTCEIETPLVLACLPSLSSL